MRGKKNHINMSNQTDNPIVLNRRLKDGASRTPPKTGIDFMFFVGGGGGKLCSDILM